ncbi:hypothetical protein [Devosia sp. RR2S18]|uniref:hypothetical protein n=1 Tax=Devosia rhizosphaerae TaxID=3049774 RepID=UPI002540A187|nr:hypothetical protein [Devosia sp. RR2S18]WIJ26603.1 hypothetical protein QOV41_07585 [Devosia sp. RR2S18]
MADLPELQHLTTRNRVNVRPVSIPVAPLAARPQAGSTPVYVPPAANGVKPTSPSEVMPVAPALRAAPAAVPNFSNIAAARAIEGGEDPGSPFSAFAQGWIKSTAEREQLEAAATEKLSAEAEEKAARETAAAELARYPDLARLVQIKGLDVSQAFDRAEERDAAAKQTGLEAQTKAETEAEKASIVEWGYANGHELAAEKLEKGIIDIDGFAAEITPAATKDAPETETFYDEETGAEYKAQWNPQTGEWEKVGGSKTTKGSGPADTTEAERRNMAIYNTVLPELKVIEQNWEALASIYDQGMSRTGANMLTQEDYQQANNSVYVVAQHYLYSLSGQAAPEGEVQRVAESIMPRIGESAAAIADKKRRLETYIGTIRLNAGRAYENAVQQGIVDAPADQVPTANPPAGAASTPAPSDLTSLSDDELLNQLGI